MHLRRTNAATLAALAAVSISGAAWADGGGHHGGGGAAPHARFAAHVFEMMDENNDGKITREEGQAAAKRLFDKLDLNGDGTITKAESDSGARAMRNEELGARFDALDADHDGRLTSAEAQVPPQVFQNLDTNKDKALSKEEFLARPDLRAEHRDFEFNRADGNHDGKVTREEADKIATERFDSVDADHDGVITRQEFDAHVAQVAKATHGQHPH
jgi:Ca2+-binding EF-hand superfamily protein